jgi:hypothetical protein
MEFFGYNFSKVKSKGGLELETIQSDPKTIKSLVSKEDDDGAIVIQGDSLRDAYAYNAGVESRFKSDSDMIFEYRRASEYPEADTAINIIVDEAINVFNNEGDPVKIDYDKDIYPISDAIIEKITDEFKTIGGMLNLETDGYKIFRDWYVDGRIYFHVLIDSKNPEKGIYDIRQLDASKVRKIREMKEVIDPDTKVKYSVLNKEYYVYCDTNYGDTVSIPVSGTSALNGVVLHPDSVIHVTSGYKDPTNRKVQSYLNKALKQIRNLERMEDSVVIYRIARAPERRIFYVDVGNLPKAKAEAYLQNIKNKYRNKITYDGATGNIINQKDHQAIMEDFWLPRREGGKGTEVSTLPGGDNLGQIEDLLFFQRKLYRALNVPMQRLEQENTFSIGRGSEITREEVALQKFITKLQRQFSKVFYNALKVQLVLKNIIKPNEWEEISKAIKFEFEKDNHFAELKANEILEGRFAILATADEYIGKYMSHDYARRVILRQSEDEIKDEDKLILAELKDPKYKDEDEDDE